MTYCGEREWVEWVEWVLPLSLDRELKYLNWGNQPSQPSQPPPRSMPTVGGLVGAGARGPLQTAPPLRRQERVRASVRPANMPDGAEGGEGPVEGVYRRKDGVGNKMRGNPPPPRPNRPRTSPPPARPTRCPSSASPSSAAGCPSSASARRWAPRPFHPAQAATALRTTCARPAGDWGAR